MVSEKLFRNAVLLALLVATFYIFSNIVFPLLFAFLAALALLGPTQWLECKGVPRWLSIILTLIIPIVVMTALGVFYYIQFDNFMTNLPDFSDKSEETAKEINKAVDEAVNVNLQAEIQKMKRNAGGLLQSSSEFISKTLATFSRVLSFVALIPVYIFFILFSRDYLKRFIKKHSSSADNYQVLTFFSEAKMAMLAYAKGLATVILIIAVLNTLGLYFIGIEYPILLGSFSALLIVIPYFGVFVGALIPTVVAFVTKDTLSYPLLVIGWYALVQFLEGNIITPKLMSAQINLNPLAIIVFLLFMGVIGGVIGLIVAVPLLALIKIALQHNSELKDYSILLQSED